MPQPFCARTYGRARPLLRTFRLPITMAACLLKRFGSHETGNFPKAELVCQVLNLDKQVFAGREEHVCHDCCHPGRCRSGRATPADVATTRYCSSTEITLPSPAPVST